MIARIDRPGVALAASLVLLAAIILVCVLGGFFTATPPLRIATLTALAAVLAVILLHPDRRVLLNPAYFLAAQAILLYSSVFRGGYLLGEPLWIGRVERQFLQGYLGSRTELLILGLGTLFLIIAMMPLYFGRGRAKLRYSPDMRHPAATAAVGGAGALAVAAFYFLESHYGPARSFVATGIGRELHHIAAPFLTFCLATAIYAAARMPARLQLLVIPIAGLCILAMMQAMQAPLPIFLLLALVLLWFAAARVSVRGVLICCCALIVAFALILILKTQIINRNHPTHPAASLERVIVAKLVERQMASAGCLNRILSRKPSEALPGNPFYFFAAPVPRSFWPDKPNLSRGSEFAEVYCGMTGAIAEGHSESITLLGEPFIEAGIPGLVVAGATLVAILLLSLRAVFSHSFVGPITVAALLPWLGAFQQHFALYIGNLFKMLLVMVPLIILLLLWQRHGRLRDEPIAGRP